MSENNVMPAQAGIQSLIEAGFPPARERRTPSRPVELHLLRVGACRHLECMAARGGRWSPVEFPALCGLIRHPQRGWLLYDTGYSEHFFAATDTWPERLYRTALPVALPQDERLKSQLAGFGLTPADIGTVIGVIRAFQAIAVKASAGPSVVASGIAEALFATAAGLFVAIPAVIAYNYFLKRSRKLSLELGRIATLMVHRGRN